VRTHYIKYFKESLFLGALLFFLITTSCTENKENNITTMITFDEYKINTIVQGDSFYIDDLKAIHSKNVDTVVGPKEIVLPSYLYEVYTDENNLMRGVVKTDKIQLAKLLSKGLLKNGYQIINPLSIDLEGKIYITSNKKLNIKKTNDFPLIFIQN
tara:strand:- start:4815 stop:5282 length:468 start_codon:yes stop_codon:yes gene_type:complete